MYGRSGRTAIADDEVGELADCVTAEEPADCVTVGESADCITNGREKESHRYRTNAPTGGTDNAIVKMTIWTIQRSFWKGWKIRKRRTMLAAQIAIIAMKKKNSSGFMMLPPGDYYPLSYYNCR
jgi:hypothetical protein